MSTRRFGQGATGILAAASAFVGGIALLLLGHALSVVDDALADFDAEPMP